MKVTILGSGSAYGVPMIFNNWGQANPQNIKNNRTRASILLEINNKNILIDAGPELRLQTNANNIKNIDSVFITHGHYDHIAGLPELPRATKLLGHSIDVWASQETMNELKQCYGYLFREKTDAEPDVKRLQWNILPDKGEFIASELEFRTLLFPHHHIHSSAFRYKNFAYVTDWQEIPENIEDFLNNLDVLIIECNNGVQPEENGHSDINKIKEIKEKFNPHNIFLTHLSARIDTDEFQKRLPDNCRLAYDGMQLDI